VRIIEQFNLTFTVCNFFLIIGRPTLYLAVYDGIHFAESSIGVIGYIIDHYILYTVKVHITHCEIRHENNSPIVKV